MENKSIKDIKDEVKYEKLFSRAGAMAGGASGGAISGVMLSSVTGNPIFIPAGAIAGAGLGVITTKYLLKDRLPFSDITLREKLEGKPVGYYSKINSGKPNKPKGWFRFSAEHALARKGIKTKGMR